MSRTTRLLAAVAAAVFLPALARAQALDYLQQSLAKVVVMATGAHLVNYEYDGVGSLFGYFIPSGGEATLYRPFRAGERYLILAVGDDDVRDLDLWVTPRGQDGQRLAEDVGPDDRPVVRFAPERTGWYTVHMKNEQSRGPGFCCFVVLVERESPRLALQSVVEALDNALAAARLHPQARKEFVPHVPVLAGGLLASRESTVTFDLVLPEGEYVVLGSGSRSVRDVDLAVKRHEAGREPRASDEVVTQDDGPEKMAMCRFRARGSRPYGIQLTNSQSNGVGFAFYVLFRAG